MVVCFYTRKLFLLKIFSIEKTVYCCLDEVSALLFLSHSIQGNKLYKHTG